MIKLKSLINEGERLDQIENELNYLNSEWDRLDSQGMTSKQQEISLRIQKLEKEKKNWLKIYGVINEKDHFAYRGDDTEFSEFEFQYIGKSTGADVIGFWFTSNKENAEYYGENIRLFKLDIKDPLIVSAEDFIKSCPKGPSYWARLARDEDRDGVILKNIQDGQRSALNTYCVFSPRQIKLLRKISGNINEKKLDVNSNKEDAAEYLIRQAWTKIPKGEDRYNADDLFLWIDNEHELNDLAWKISKQFYPNDNEAWYTFQKDIIKVLHNLETKRLKQRQSKTPSLKDPLYILKRMMVGKDWNQVKRTVAKNSLGGFVAGGNLDDEDVESVFNRLYRNAMGETIYDPATIDHHKFGYLDKLQYKEITNTLDSESIRQYIINQFLRSYATNGNLGDKLRVWRGTNNPHAGIRPGDFVTLDRAYATNYTRGKWKAVVTDIINTKDLVASKLDHGTTEFVYWPEGHQIKKYEGQVPSLKDFWQQYRFGI